MYEPNNCFNLTSKFSNSLPTLTKLILITRPAPKPIKAFLNRKYCTFTLANPPLTPLKACLVLSRAIMFILNFVPLFIFTYCLAACLFGFYTHLALFSSKLTKD